MRGCLLGWAASVGLRKAQGIKAEGSKLGEVTKVWPVSCLPLWWTGKERGAGTGSPGRSPAPGLPLPALASPVRHPAVPRRSGAREVFAVPIASPSHVPLPFLGLEQLLSTGQFPRPCLGGRLGVPRAGG